MNINDKVQFIDCICRNGHKETINLIVHAPPEITAGYIIANCYIELAKMMRFTRQENGIFIKMK